MGELVIFCLAPGEEAALAHVEVEALEASIPEADNGVLLADVALGLVLGALGRGEPVQHRQPDHRLGLLLEPAEEVHGLDLVLVLAGFLEAAAHRGLDVGAAEGSHLAKLTRHLDAIMQQQAELALVHQTVRVGDQSE